MSIYICAHKWISDASNELIKSQGKFTDETCVSQIQNVLLAHIPDSTNLNHRKIENCDKYNDEHNDNECVLGKCVNSECTDENIFSASAINTHEEARREAAIILCHCLGIDRVQLHLKEQFLATEAQYLQLSNYLARRIQGEPLAYIFGQKEFFGIDFIVNKHTLIPRPETEFLVEESLFYGNDTPLTILDLGCGSGCIALSILKNRSNWQAVLVDISQETLATANENSINLNLEKNVHFIFGDFTCENFRNELMHACKNIPRLFDSTNNTQGVDKKDIINQDEISPMSLENSIENTMQFDIIISNPPYIPMEEYQKLHTSVKDHEPKVALLSSAHLTNKNNAKSTIIKNESNLPDNSKPNDTVLLKNKGLYHIQNIIHLAEKILKPHGLLLIEHGYNQAQDCRNLCDTKEWESVSSGKDYAHIERYLKAFRKKN